MAVEKEAEQETTLPEENHEVDADIQLLHKVFLLSNPTPVSYTHLTLPTILLV